MREIKFKMWDTINRQMLFNVQLGTEEKETMITICSYPDHITLQFTEFWDIDNKEIYEGDELSLEHIYSGLTSSCYWTVVFKDGMWMIQHGEQLKSLYSTLKHYHVRVNKSKYER